VRGGPSEILRPPHSRVSHRQPVVDVVDPALDENPRRSRHHEPLAPTYVESPNV